jgi:hypothetical protein
MLARSNLPNPDEALAMAAKRTTLLHHMDAPSCLQGFRRLTRFRRPLNTTAFEFFAVTSFTPIDQPLAGFANPGQDLRIRVRHHSEIAPRRCRITQFCATALSR